MVENHRTDLPHLSVHLRYLKNCHKPRKHTKTKIRKFKKNQLKSLKETLKRSERDSKENLKRPERDPKEALKLLANQAVEPNLIVEVLFTWHVVVRKVPIANSKGSLKQFPKAL